MKCKNCGQQLVKKEAYPSFTFIWLSLFLITLILPFLIIINGFDINLKEEMKEDLSTVHIFKTHIIWTHKKNCTNPQPSDEK